MRWIISYGNMLDHPSRRTVDDRDPVVRRVGVYAAIAMTRHGMRSAQTRTRRRTVGIEHQIVGIAGALESHSITPFEHRDGLAHGQSADTRAHRSALPAQGGILFF